jgi:hypothetical protein
MNKDNKDTETLRWPTDLDRAAMVERLIGVRAMAVEAGLADLAQRLEGVETVPSAELGSKVIGALTLIQEKPEYLAITTQLATVAMNLKNLK